MADQARDIGDRTAENAAIEKSGGEGRDSSQKIEDAARKSRDQDRPEGRERPHRETEAKDRGLDKQSLSPTETREREAQSTLPDRVPFKFGKSDTTLDEVRRVIEQMSPRDREKLKDPGNALYLHATASRVGNYDHNLTLSEQRGKSVAELIEVNRERLGIAARVVVNPMGEGKAKQEGRADERDDRDDRAVQFEVVGRAPEKDAARFTDHDAKQLVTGVLDRAGVVDLSKVDTVREAGDRAMRVGKEALEVARAVGKGDYEKIVEKAISLQAKTLLESQGQKEYRENVAANLIPAFHQKLDRETIGHTELRAPLVHERIPGRGYSDRQGENALKAVAMGESIVVHGLTVDQRDLLKDVMKDSDSRRLIHLTFERELHHRLNHPR